MVGCGEVCFCHHLGDIHVVASCGERSWLALGGPFVLFTQTSVLSLYRASVSGPIGSFQVGQAFAAWKTTTIVISLTSGYGQGHNLQMSFGLSFQY